MRKITYRQALNEAITEEMLNDVTVFVMGQDVGLYGGIFKVTEGLLDKFGQDRVRDTPLSETAIIGGGVGAAITGMRPICELMLADFVVRNRFVVACAPRKRSRKRSSIRTLHLDTHCESNLRHTLSANFFHECRPDS